jgi:hypothetical protein
LTKFIHLDDADSANRHDQQIPEIGVKSEASGDDVEHGVAENSGRRNSQKNIPLGRMSSNFFSSSLTLRQNMPKLSSCGLNYKHVTIVNDDSSIVSK